MRRNDFGFNTSQEKDAIYQAVRSVILDSILDTQFGSLLDQIMSGWVRNNSLSAALDLLPFYIYESQDYAKSRVLPIAAAWVLLRLAAKSFDDIEDGDISDKYGEATNLASGVLVAASQALTVLGRQCNLSDRSILTITEECNRSILRACQGQQLEIIIKQDSSHFSPEDWLSIATAKSGELLGWVSWASAFLTFGNTSSLENYRKFGCHLGVLLQVIDDYDDFYVSKGEDYSSVKTTLPVCYALYVADLDERMKIIELLKDASLGNEDAKLKARQAISGYGAIEYLISVAWLQRQLAVDAIRSNANYPHASQSLVTLLDQLMSALATKKVNHVPTKVE